MKLMKKFIIPLLAVLFFAFGTPAPETGRGEDGECFTVLVGKNASADGSAMIGHNEDDRGEIIVNLRLIRPSFYPSPQKVDLGRGAFHETEGVTNGFLWIEATTQEFADSFVNDHGVVITSDSCPSRITEADLTDGGIGYMLRRFMAEKATSAREAVKIGGALIEKYGYRASGRTYSIVDKNEAWMLAVLRGRHWCAERVPDDEVAVIPNHFTIRRIDLDDPDHFMASPGLVEYATKSGWYDEAKDGPFDFKRVFERSSNRDLVSNGNTLRHWRGLNLIGGKTWELSDDYPFSSKPGKKVTVEALMTILRDHYEGTEYDATDGYKTGTPNRTKFRTICTASTINSFVITLNPKRPDPISVSIWLALGKPDTTVFLPLYLDLGKLPPGAGTGTDFHDYDIFNAQHFKDTEFRAAKGALLHTKVLELERIAEANYGPMQEVLKRELFPAEKTFLDNRGKFEAEIAALYAKDIEEAVEKLDAYVATAFQKVSEITKKILANNPES